MTLWWIANAVLILVLIPVVVLLLQRLTGAARAVSKSVDTIHNQSGGIVLSLNDVKQLIPVRDAVKRVATGLTRYVQAVARIL